MSGPSYDGALADNVIHAEVGLSDYPHAPPDPTGNAPTSTGLLTRKLTGLSD